MSEKKYPVVPVVADTPDDTSFCEPVGFAISIDNAIKLVGEAGYRVMRDGGLFEFYPDYDWSRHGLGDCEGAWTVTVYTPKI